jgi:predicted  nucleic acid-binding Zn-ribbon protein
MTYNDPDVMRQLFDLEKEKLEIKDKIAELSREIKDEHASLKEIEATISKTVAQADDMPLFTSD